MTKDHGCADVSSWAKRMGRNAYKDMMTWVVAELEMKPAMQANLQLLYSPGYLKRHS